MSVQGQPIRCDVTQIVAHRNFDFWGDDICASAYIASVLPGRLARLELETTLAGQRYEFALQATDFHVASPRTLPGPAVYASESPGVDPFARAAAAR